MSNDRNSLGRFIYFQFNESFNNLVIGETAGERRERSFSLVNTVKYTRNGFNEEVGVFWSKLAVASLRPQDNTGLGGDKMYRCSEDECCEVEN